MKILDESLIGISGGSATRSAGPRIFFIHA